MITTNHRTVYHNKVQSLLEAAKNIAKVVESESLKSEFIELIDGIKNQKFSIGVTGIIKAGKSTMLNALMGKEILGTGIVPETANLTVIKYSESPKATVKFWTLDEWNGIKSHGEEYKIEEIVEYVKSAEEKFNTKLHEFITLKGLIIEIEVEDLPKYTSAKHSELLCNLVKEVELYVPLQFTHDGVEIVDTPGIDDPVVQREEITQRYLAKCDIMMHLMNAAQSVTQKDIDFILNAVLYQKVSRLIIILTRIDSISEVQLKEVTDYTEGKIIEYLVNQTDEASEASAKIEDIKNKLVFIPLSGKSALMHRIGKSEKAKLPLEKTGITLVENLLNEMLFGEKSEKANILVKSSTSQLQKLSNNYAQLLKNEEQNIGKSVLELQEELEHLSEKIAITDKTLDGIRIKIALEAKDIAAFLQNINVFYRQLEETRQHTQHIVKEYISTMLFEKKSKPDEEHIKKLVEKNIKDCLNEISETYQQMVNNKLESVFSKLEKEYHDAFQNTDVYSNISAISFNFSKLFGSGGISELSITAGLYLINFSIGFGIASIISSVFICLPIVAILGFALVYLTNKALEQKQQKEIEEIDKKLTEGFDKIFNQLKDKLHEELSANNEQIKILFLTAATKPAQEIEKRLLEKQENLNQQVRRLKEQKVSNDERQRVIQDKAFIINQELTYIGSIVQSQKH